MNFHDSMALLTLFPLLELHLLSRPACKIFLQEKFNPMLPPIMTAGPNQNIFILLHLYSNDNTLSCFFTFYFNCVYSFSPSMPLVHQTCLWIPASTHFSPVASGNDLVFQNLNFFIVKIELTIRTQHISWRD